AWIVELWRIEEVKKLRPELQARRLMERHGFEERKVDLPGPRTLKYIAARVTPLLKAWISKGCGVEPLSERSMVRRQRTIAAGAHKLGPGRDSIRDAQRVAAGQHGEGNAVRVGGDPVHSPALHQQAVRSRSL